MRGALVAIAAAALTPSGATAQPAAAAAVADGATVESAVAALYDVISGPAGRPRDWARFRALFAPEGRLVPVGARGPLLLAPDAYIARAEPMMMKDGFFEREVARRVERYGNVAHVFSTYEARHAADAAPFLRGINSIQLVRIGDAWRILSVTWQAETPALPIPKDYLRAGRPR